MESLPPSIANASVSQSIQNLSSASSAIQVCHYPIASIGNVYSKLPQDASNSPKLVSIGGPNTVTFLLGQTAPPTAQNAYGVPPSIAPHPNLPLQIPVTLETNLISSTSGFSSNSPITYSCQGTSKIMVSMPYPHYDNTSISITSVPNSVHITSSHVENLNNQIQYLHGHQLLTSQLPSNTLKRHVHLS